MIKLKIGSLIFVGLLLTLVPSFENPLLASTKDGVNSLNEETIISLVNQHRAEMGVSELKSNDVLASSAQLKAEDMARKSYFSHINPEGLDAWHWFDRAGYDYRFAGENLGVNFRTASGLMNGWMNSPTHRENILNGNYLEIGIGVAEGTYKGKSTIFVVQHFGTLQDQSHKQTKENNEIQSEMNAILKRLEILRLSLLN